MDIGRAIAVERAKIGMSQLELASRVPCSVSYICKVEKGRKGIRDVYLHAVARVLGVKPEYLREEGMKYGE